MLGAAAALVGMVLAEQAQDAAKKALIEGNVAYRRGDLDAAHAAYASCLDVAPERSDCATNLASVLVDLGPEHEAVAEALYRRVLDAYRAAGIGEGEGDGSAVAADAAFNLALLLQDRRTEAATAEAATLYESAAAHDEMRWDAWANLAAALSESKAAPLKAIHAYQRAILILEHQQQAGPGGEGGEGAYLAKLYYGYGIGLAELRPEHCAALANDPSSLLLGGGNGDGGARTANCNEDAQNALRTSLSYEPRNAQATRCTHHASRMRPSHRARNLRRSICSRRYRRQPAGRRQSRAHLPHSSQRCLTARHRMLLSSTAFVISAISLSDKLARRFLRHIRREARWRPRLQGARDCRRGCRCAPCVASRRRTVRRRARRWLRDRPRRAVHPPARCRPAHPFPTDAPRHILHVPALHMHAWHTFTR